MFVVSIRWRNFRKKILALVGVLAVCSVLGIWGMQSSKGKTAAVQAQPQREEQLQIVSKKMAKVPNNKARLAFLAAFGWETEEEAAEVVEVAVPKEFGDVYLNYNEIQKKQGLDLLKYRGKIVKRYTYIVRNYPERAENIRANLLVYKSKVIGGDICSLEAANGFMHGFCKIS